MAIKYIIDIIDICQEIFLFLSLIFLLLIIFLKAKNNGSKNASSKTSNKIFIHCKFAAIEKLYVPGIVPIKNILNVLYITGINSVVKIAINNFQFIPLKDFLIIFSFLFQFLIIEKGFAMPIASQIHKK